MKLISAIIFCLVFGLGVFAQTEVPQIQSDTVKVEEIFLAKDNGEGAPGDAVESFLTTDIPIFCVVQLDSLKSVNVKMNFVAVAVKGVKAETKVISVNFKTNGKQNRVYFTGTPDGNWVAGTYRVDIFVDGKAAGSKEFQIRNSVLENPAIQTLQPKTPPKSPRRARKN
jgi:hypothetical protein